MMHTSIHEIELLGIRTVYTDHSIMSTQSIAGIAMNKVFRSFSCNIHAFICVSQANALNFLRRQDLERAPSSLYVIPNGVDKDAFYKDSSFLHNPTNSRDSIIISVVSRLVIRKGVLLLVEIIDFVVANYPNVLFIIAGDGDEMHLFSSRLSMWNRCRTRVRLVGEIAHSDVPAFLV